MINLSKIRSILTSTKGKIALAATGLALGGAGAYLYSRINHTNDDPIPKSVKETRNQLADLAKKTNSSYDKLANAVLTYYGKDPKKFYQDLEKHIKSGYKDPNSSPFIKNVLKFLMAKDKISSKEK